MPVIQYPGANGGTFDALLALVDDRRAAEWFCQGDGLTLVGTYALDDINIRIICCGEMLWDVNNDYWRTAQDIPEWITGDEDLRDVMADDRTVMYRSCWFEVFAAGYESHGHVCDDLDWAIQIARDLAVQLRGEMFIERRTAASPE